MIIQPRPGQTYAWTAFKVGKGLWMIEFVTEARRTDMLPGSWGAIAMGQLFTLITTDDPGPFSYEYEKGRCARWHVALLGDRLFWCEHAMLTFSELVVDAV
jgi:hypothetical protein